MKNQPFFNVMLVSIAFLFIFAANNTGYYIQKVVVDSINSYQPDIGWDPYISLCIVFAVYSISNFLVPSLHTLFSYKKCLFFGSLLYLISIIAFLYPIKYGLIIVSILHGVAAAILWSTEWNYLSENSTSTTLDRNAGIFWSVYQFSLVFGNLYYYLQFQGIKEISPNDRIHTYSVLSVMCLIGCILFLFLRKPNTKDESKIIIKNIPPLSALKNCFSLLKTKKMLYLSIASIYLGLELSFFQSIYATSVGFTASFGEDSKKYIGLYGVSNGLGGITGALFFNTVLKRFIKNNRSRIYFLGFICQIIAFSLIFVNHANVSTIHNTYEFGLIKPKIWIVLFCGFLLCLGDSCFNTQITSLIGSSYSDPMQNSAYALFNFFLSLGSSVSFFYASYSLGLRTHLIILTCFSILSTLTFFLAERIDKKAVKNSSM